MWDVVFNSKHLSQSSTVDCSRSLNSTTFRSDIISNGSATRLAPLACCDDKAQSQLVLTTRSFQPTEIFNESAPDALGEEVPLYHAVPAAAQLALEDGLVDVEEEEPDVYSEIIKDSKDQFQVDALTLVDSGSILSQSGSQNLEMKKHAASTAVSPCKLLYSKHSLQMEILGDQVPSNYALPIDIDDSSPMVHSSAQSFQASQLPEDVTRGSIPKKPSSKKLSSRPRHRRSRPDDACQIPCPSFRMDHGETAGACQRESSLARHYDALDASSCKRRDEMTAIHASRTRDCSLSRSYEALDSFTAPVQLPPVKGKTIKGSPSRFSARHRASMAAASVMAWELGSRDTDQIHPHTSASAGLHRAADSKRRSSDVGKSVVAPSSACSLDLDESVPKDFSERSEFTPTHSLPVLRPFAISASKLPRLPSRSQHVNAAEWSVPRTRHVGVC